MWYLVTILLAVIGVGHVSADCRTCATNGIACISETEFYLCIDGTKMDESVKYTCPDGNICTGLGIICANATSSTAVALCTNQCDQCLPGKAFACTGRTTFALCSANELTSVVGTCPDGLLCDTDGTTGICKEKCEITEIKCDRDATSTTITTTPDPVTSSTATPSTATPAAETTATPTPAPPQTAAQVCAVRNTAGRFPYDNDNACINYVYCRYQGTTLVAVDNTCPTGTYFNSSTQNCVTAKPAGCI